MADCRHKRDTNARPRPRAALVAGPLAVLATASAITLGMVVSEPTAQDVPVSAAISERSAGISAELLQRDAIVSRSSDRSLATAPVKQGMRIEKKSDLELMMAKQAVAQAVSAADTKRWTTTELNLWTSPAQKAEKAGVLDAEKKVLVTGRSLFDRDEVVIDGASRWISSGYLADEKPVDESEEEAAAAPAADASCSNGSSVASGVSPNIVKVHAAVCAAFPEITTYGTFRSDGEHAQGIAVDIMVSGARGWEVAEFVRANAGSLGVSYAIYSRNIWSVERSGEGWRGMSDRGSTTANHEDHVHVTTY
ncbi:hypothetical protein I601_3756 [Nocardioides dokdonensis FR1436]|uniref:ARB-07466-like C-terminal domain-containing protein n=1 Tax=Nocardioides dokdonensis FR1436 TaxID=1300347 RepID=A0A1A9GRR5_9ACTN|nr:hypothetical protein [Nocardioides dokdonensis]ANH40155.1 hypothetical protein I601_3756 [Nocardioides dokdonensis FR1436]